MKIAIYIADLTAANARLMPWRTVLEVAGEFLNDKIETMVFSGRDIVSSHSSEQIGEITVQSIPRVTAHNKNDLAVYIQNFQIKYLYFPIAFVRSYAWASKIEQQTGCRIVWYLPGGWYSVRQCWSASLVLGWRKVLPYWVQALYPKKLFFSDLKKGRLRAMVCFSDYSRRLATRFYPAEAIFVALPGKSSELIPFRKKPTVSFSPYFLFFGPPNPIRGLSDVLSAFEQVAAQVADIRLHLCLRNDGNTDATSIRKQLNNHRFRDRIECQWDSCSAEELANEISNSFAVLKPFLIVPSEIPLAVLEAATFGKPVIGTGPDGTGDIIQQFGLTVPHGNRRKLAQAMIRLLTDKSLYQDKVRDAFEVTATLPTWSESAAIWRQAALMENK